MAKLHKLTQEIINQIAAGEVVERPASVVKELIDNSIDAQSTQIKVKIKEGGLKYIEVADNGVGIEKENLIEVFNPHTTSKLSKIEDLNNLNTMGFRGEALATIKSVARVSIASKHIENDNGYRVDFAQDSQITLAAKDTGTTVSISDLFFNTPARLKFMKSPETEYRKILDIFLAYALAYPKIHFILEKDGKTVLNFVSTNDNYLSLTRIKDVLKKEYVSSMIEIKSEGAGVKVVGYVGHPSSAGERVSDQYIYVNNRPIWDNGIAKSIYSGFSRFIPHTFKVPFVIKLYINSDMVDVNVHPRKEEVKFINPYRIYVTVEEAVISALKANTQDTYNTQVQSQINVIPQSNKYSSSLLDTSTIKYTPRNEIKEIKFDKRPSDFNISKSMDFSKEVLTHSDTTLSDTFLEFKTIYQLFNKYIFVEFEKDLWIIDQHAAAERITFEKFLNSYGKNIDIQQLLVPISIKFNSAEISFIGENLELFTNLGFKLSVTDEGVDVFAIPAHITNSNIEEVFTSIFSMDEITLKAEKNAQKLKEDILATMACHSSVRAGQKLSYEECKHIYQQLGKCENPYSCPHGRPAVWRLKLSDIDSNFFRTY